MNVLDDLERRAGRQVRRQSQEAATAPVPMAAAPVNG